MAKTNAKKTQTESKINPDETSVEVKKIDMSDPAIQHAIEQGMALIKDGKSKADAARAIYDLLESQGKEVIVAAFIAGATLTAKGALTYWYNCKRKKEKGAAKE
jgi:transcriptional/translational regulatory protein YebC/TACO1